MTNVIRESTTVVVIGAGVAGTTVGNLLKSSGVDCIVLEQRDRAYIEHRQRAGNIEARAVRMFEEWGLADRIVGGFPYEGIVDLRVDGVQHFLKEELDDETPGRLCPQQILVRNLIATFIDDGGDLRFEAAEVTLHELNSERPLVCYRDTTGAEHQIRCDFIAGCDGDHGISRVSIPRSAIAKYEHDYGVSWLVVLADVPAGRYPLMGISERGFAAQFQRGPKASRFYLQCNPHDTPEDWPNARVWDEVRKRFAQHDFPNGEISDKSVLPLYSVVYAPMRYGRLFLLGDAAHLIPPTSVKGMNLALSDAETFARAVRDFVGDRDTAGLDAYSDTCLRRIWNYQEFAIWVTEMLHDAGDASLVGPFRRKAARARLDRLFKSSSANKLYSEFMAGTN